MYGGDYCSRKYLQEKACPMATHARNEPYQVEQTADRSDVSRFAIRVDFILFVCDIFPIHSRCWNK